MLPFDRFPGVDTLLGPEMRSTGEVMGIGSTFGLAFAKSQIAAGTRLPSEGAVFLSLADRDKAGGPRRGADLQRARVRPRGHLGHGRLPRVQRCPGRHGGGQGGGVRRGRRRGPHRFGPRPARGEHPARPGAARRRRAHPIRRPRAPGPVPDDGGRGACRRDGYRRLERNTGSRSCACRRCTAVHEERRRPAQLRRIGSAPEPRPHGVGHGRPRGRARRLRRSLHVSALSS